MSSKKIRLAILDMNDNEPNEGLRCIKELVEGFREDITFDVFDVRSKEEVPDTSYDIYISSGGPGSPLEDRPWRAKYLELIQKLWDHNKNALSSKKHVFFICYSFQVVCDYFELGTVKLRKSMSFGILPVHKTKKGRSDALLDGLDDPYYAVDSREWQLIQPRLKVFEEHGATILSLEKIRTYVEYERAIMAVRFSREFVGTQFHPEADAPAMKRYFSKEENVQLVIDNFGEEKYHRMLKRIDDPNMLERTHAQILPKFIATAVA
ncbi:MAG: GMP synthase, partial [Bacteroidota bacterium]